MTTTRFGLLEIDGITPATPPTPAPAIVQRSGESTARAGDLDMEGRARAIAVDSALARHGLAFSEPTFFAWGTRGQWGDAAARARQELHAMPLHSAIADKAKAIVAAEQRDGTVVDMRMLSYAGSDATGVDDLAGQDTGGARFSHRCSPQALRQAMARANAPGGAYLGDPRLPAMLRSTHANHWLRLRDAEERKAHERAHAAWCMDALAIDDPAQRAKHAAQEPRLRPQQAKILTKLDSNGRRGAYGTVGPRYPHGYGMDRVIADISDLFPDEARGCLIYDEATTRWSVDAAVGAEFEPVVGDVYRLGVRYGAHDAGGGSYYADLYGIRVRCVNFTKIHGLKRLGKVRHIGSIESLQARIRDLVSHGTEAMHGYSNAVREANEAAICERALAGDGDARTVFGALIAGGYLPAPEGEEIAVSRYFDAWLKEPGYNRIDFVNAATRAAHEGTWASPWVTEEIEAQAGKLLYQRLVLTEAQVPAAA